MCIYLVKLVKFSFFFFLFATGFIIPVNKDYQNFQTAQVTFKVIQDQ